MAACTFFGHRECPDSIKPKLREVLIEVISNHDVDIPNQGWPIYDTQKAILNLMFFKITISKYKSVLLDRLATQFHRNIRFHRFGETVKLNRE